MEDKIYCYKCKNFKIKDLGNGFAEIICLKDKRNPYCDCKYFEKKEE